MEVETGPQHQRNWGVWHHTCFLLFALPVAAKATTSADWRGGGTCWRMWCQRRWQQNTLWYRWWLRLWQSVRGPVDWWIHWRIILRWWMCGHSTESIGGWGISLPWWFIVGRKMAVFFKIPLPRYASVVPPSLGGGQLLGRHQSVGCVDGFCQHGVLGGRESRKYGKTRPLIAQKLSKPLVFFAFVVLVSPRFSCRISQQYPLWLVKLLETLHEFASHSLAHVTV